MSTSDIGENALENYRGEEELKIRHKHEAMP